MSDAAYKALLFVIYPLLALFLAVTCVAILVLAWPMIPFARVVRDGKKTTLKFPL